MAEAFEVRKSVTVDVLARVATFTKRGILVERLPVVVGALEFGECTTPLRTCHALAQFAFESNYFRAWVEADDGRHFAQYDGNKKLGNDQPGDGARYRGRGLVQLTGRSNYTLAARALRFDLVERPELAGLPEVAARVAGWYWRAWGCNAPADRDDIEGVTRLINGGLNGLTYRLEAYKAAKLALRVP